MTAREAARPTGFRGLDRLAVHHDRRRRRLTTLGFARGHGQKANDLCPQAAVTPSIEPVLDRRIGRKLIGREPPWAAGADQVEQGVQYVAGIGGLAPTPFGRRQQRADQGELRVRHIA